jgi:hypothetical protein
MSNITAEHPDQLIHSASPLRRHADQVNPIVAPACRRRANELRFEAWRRRIGRPKRRPIVAGARRRGAPPSVVG